MRVGWVFDEFKKFALRGNVVDLAIGIIIGSAFGRIVDSMVGDIFMPLIGAVTGGLDFSNYYFSLGGEFAEHLSYPEAKRRGAVLGWGQFVTVTVNFFLVAWVLFWLVRLMNRLRAREIAREVAKSPDVALLAEIRDLLAAQAKQNYRASQMRDSSNRERNSARGDEK